MIYLKKLFAFLFNKNKPFLFGLIAGLYPVFFYYTNNYALVNSRMHIVFFVTVFLLVPAISFKIIYAIFSINSLKKWQKYVLPFLSVFTFLFLLKVCLYAGIQKKISLAIFLISIVIAYFFYKQLKKIVGFQLLLAAIGLITLVPTIIRQLSFSETWKKQPDDIAQVVFKKKPNVYFIQPDGYPNPSELKKGYYNIDNHLFENYLTGKNFKIYTNYRSNYTATLPSNSSMLMMKHHYYNKGVSHDEAINARELIVNDNTVLNIFKNNGYKTFLVLEKPYFLANKPKIGYDYSNFTTSDIGFLDTGFKKSKDVINSLKGFINKEPLHPKFFFIEFFNPGHVTNIPEKSLGKEGNKKKWIESLQVANNKLKLLIDFITQQDPEALIIITADHGGFVGMNTTQEVYKKTQDSDLIYSIFSSMLAIKWPENEAPKFDTQFKSSVNLFRIIFTFMSENKKYLNALQPNGSFVIIHKGAPKGIYQYIDESGKITFKKI
jgi:hypothetical protein